MNTSCYSVSFGQHRIRYKLLFAERKTLEIAVHPDGSVVVKAPVGTNQEAVAGKVLKRATWIIRQRDYFSQFEPRSSGRYYVGGESHLYLGRRYRIKICSEKPEAVKLKRGFLMVNVNGSNSPEHIRILLDRWYARNAVIKFRERFERCWSRFGQPPLKKPGLQIRRMKTRWGSLSNNGLMTLNTDLVRAPVTCIDYVITHELCHAIHHDHGPDFYRLLENMMPDWKHRKKRLEFTLL